MNWLGRDLLIWAALLGALLSISAEGWALQRIVRQARRASAQLELKKVEREHLQQQSPIPTEENERAILRDVSDTKEKLATAEAALSGDDGGVFRELTPSSITPMEAYFEIASFVERTREAAARNGVTLRAEEHFGFSSYTSEGPPTELISDVLRQCTAVHFLLDALFEARPAALLFMQREPPLNRTQRSDRNRPGVVARDGLKSPAERNEPADFFALGPAISVRVPGKVETDAFRLEFSAQTGTLRAFLNRIASEGKCFVVRSVEVEPMAAAPVKVSGAAAISSTTPIVNQTLSRCRVMVELAVPFSQMERAAP